MKNKSAHMVNMWACAIVSGSSFCKRNREMGTAGNYNPHNVVQAKIP